LDRETRKRQREVEHGARSPGTAWQPCVNRNEPAATKDRSVAIPAFRHLRPLRFAKQLSFPLCSEDHMAPASKQYLGNVWVLETSVAYRNEVVRYLDLIRTTTAGNTLFKFINQRPQWMLIMPFHPTRKDPVNAYAYPVPGSEADSYAKYSFMMTPFKLPNGVTIEIPTGIGTGRGSMVYLDFHPATWRQRIKNTGGIAPGTGPGEILFHEMIHGYRMQCGLARDDKVAGHQQMDNIEEFYHPGRERIPFRPRLHVAAHRPLGIRTAAADRRLSGSFLRHLQERGRRLVQQAAAFLPRHGEGAGQVQSVPASRDLARPDERIRRTDAALAEGEQPHADLAACSDLPACVAGRSG
jgi:hypothetical protein